VRRNAQRDELLRARTRVAGDAVLLEPVGGQESHMIVRAADADALAFVPRGDGELPAGSPVRYLSVVA
jgi:molybdopterin biosynthesis enzyme